MYATRRTLLAVLALSLLLSVPGTGSALTEYEVSKGLLCPACPGEALSTCRCGGAEQARSDIRKMLAEGKEEEEILQYFVGVYGEQILTEPPKRGFNLVAYFGPFVGLAIGILAALFFVRRWAVAGARGDAPSDVGQAEPPPLDEAARRRVEEALANLDEED